jgi:hypothetical protein
MHCLLIVHRETVSATGEHGAWLHFSVTPFMCASVCCLQQVNTCLHCLLLPSSDTGSATGEHLLYLHSLLLVRQRESLHEHLACLHCLLLAHWETVSATGEHMACLLFLHRRQCLQQVRTWRVCIVCYSFIGQSVCNRWARGVSAMSAIPSSETVSATGEHVACLLLPSSESVSATSEHLACLLRPSHESVSAATMTLSAHGPT